MRMPEQRIRSFSRHGIYASAAMLVALAGSAHANDNPVILQWFECQWRDVEHRAPDFFMAGYGATWLPPATKAMSSASVGYDIWDRFDLGSPNAPTAYGTEEGFRAMVGELHGADGLVYADSVLNHNGPRIGSASFQERGGYPGFWMNSGTPPQSKGINDDWGDFHSGRYQSHDPGGSWYDLFEGDLVGLIDIAQETNNQFIRQPVAQGEPQNIPAGTVFNRPNADNVRFYPDRDLNPFTFTNPGAHGNGPLQFTLYPYNAADPGAGDAVADNGTGMLMRWSQWMLEEHKVDGFRLDAAKHVPNWFWDMFFDSSVYLRWTTPSGRAATPLSFVEVIDGNGFIADNYVRLRDGFGNRDALDINGGGGLRNLINAGGFGSWQDALNGHLDNQDDGLNNGSLGVNHVFSHDNGSVGDGGSQPPLPSVRQQGLPQNAYVLMRPGRSIVYHNARGINRGGGFWPREGNSTALGLNPAADVLDDSLTKLVQLHNEYGRGLFNPITNTDPNNPSPTDVLVFERRSPIGGGDYSANVLVAVNDRFDSGAQQRNVRTSFAPGTRLHELTGAAGDALVDPSGQIPQVLIVGGDRRVALTVPNNVSSAGEHGRGYVIYGPVAPLGVLELTNVTGVIEADPSNAPAAVRRLTDVDVVEADSFEIQLTTMAADPLDPNTDDEAIFRLDQGYFDYNGNGQIDPPTRGSVSSGYEAFMTLNEPLYGSGQAEGLYVQEIDATQLAEGYHYISVMAFRHREANEAPILREIRRVVYVDREGPALEVTNLPERIEEARYEFAFRFLDRTGTRVHVFWDLPDGMDPIVESDFANLAARRDRFEWRKTVVDLQHGWHTLTLAAFEASDNAAVYEFEIFVDHCAADFDDSGEVNTLDFLAFLNAFNSGDPAADFNGDGSINSLDFLAFLNAFNLGCG